MSIRHTAQFGSSRLLRTALRLLITWTALPVSVALALITGGEGNAPLHDPGWPGGAAVIFNHSARVAWWEGPPLGGGQWHAEYRGDAQALAGVLAEFAKLDVQSKRIVLHDGVGCSFWLNPNDDPAKRQAARIDWTFMVWQPDRWNRLRTLPPDLNPIGPGDAEQEPPSQIDIYMGDVLGGLPIDIPAGIELVDQRLTAHGFAATDGTVLEGNVVDLATQLPLAARMRLQRVEPQTKGGYQYTTVSESKADDRGHWILKQAPAGWYRVVIDHDGYVPRVIGYARFDEQPRWHSFDGALAQPGLVSGRITDEAGQPLAEVNVRLGNVAPNRGGRYESDADYATQTDADGQFRLEWAPVGTAAVRLHKAGYCRPGLGEPIIVPTADISLTMTASAQVCVMIDFAATERPAEYIVEMEPEEGAAVGKWSGSGRIDGQGQITFTDVPPGRYVVQGHPNPSSADQRTEPQTIDLQGGQTTQITLRAKSAP